MSLASLLIFAVALGGSTNECRSFSATKLPEGKDFQFAITDKLAIELAADGRWGWGIAVHEAGDRAANYAWPLSPPLQTAPHLKIGPGYGLSAQESTRFARQLKFVTRREDYEAAFSVASARPFDVNQYLAVVEHLTAGELRIRITDFGIRRATGSSESMELEALAWISFAGEACLPASSRRR